MDIQVVRNKIYELRGYRIMLDSDLAELYGVEAKRLKEAVRRNITRFPSDFMFELTREEYKVLRTQIASLEKGKGKYSKYNPFAFTEQGVAMLASVLNSPVAIEVNIQIVRAFVAVRQHLSNFEELKKRITEIEKEMQMQFADIHEALNYLFQEKQQEVEQKERRKIGYKIKNK